MVRTHMIEAYVSLQDCSVEVFKTNVRNTREARIVLKKLAEEFPLQRINFDLDDCDRILRIEGVNISERHVIAILNALGYSCELLQ